MEIFAAYATARDELLKFLDNGTCHPANGALYALDTKLTLLSDFTTDIKELKAVVEDFKPQAASKVQDVYTAASPFSCTQRPLAQPPNQEITVNALEHTGAGALAGYPGRKNLIWLSQAFPHHAFSGNYL